MQGRHGRNATNSAVYSYAERQQDKKESFYGLQSRRVGTDSLLVRRVLLWSAVVALC